MDELKLCKPCAERLKTLRTVAEVTEIRKIGGGQKIDCEQCGRRRYGYLYAVTFRPLTQQIV